MDLNRASDSWLYLNAVCERPTRAMWDFVDEFGPEEAAARIKRRDLAGYPFVAAQTDARAGDVDPLALRSFAAEHGARFLSPVDAGWPGMAFAPLDWPRLVEAPADRRDPTHSIPLAPFGLWLRGGPEFPDFGATRAASIVGTRDLTNYGRVVAAEIAEASAGEDIAVISGGALGADIAAHLGALSADGVTTAVLACGVDKLYPSANARTLATIAESGGLVSEYAPGTGVTRYRFLDRNRIIAALGQVTVVVEAAMRSGALSTARWAHGMERPVYAVPGSIHSRASAGCNSLLGMYAMPITRSGEIGELVPTLGLNRPLPTNPYDVGRPRPISRPGNPTLEMSDNERRTFEALRGDVDQSTEQIAIDSGIPVAATRNILEKFAAGGIVHKDGLYWKLPDRRDVVQTSLPF